MGRSRLKFPVGWNDKKYYPTVIHTHSAINVTDTTNSYITMSVFCARYGSFELPYCYMLRDNSTLKIIGDKKFIVPRRLNLLGEYYSANDPNLEWRVK